jgi:hypothetical protein
MTSFRRRVAVIVVAHLLACCSPRELQFSVEALG